MMLKLLPCTVSLILAERQLPLIPFLLAASAERTRLLLCDSRFVLTLLERRVRQAPTPSVAVLQATEKRALNEFRNVEDGVALIRDGDLVASGHSGRCAVAHGDDSGRRKGLLRCVSAQRHGYCPEHGYELYANGDDRR